MVDPSKVLEVIDKGLDCARELGHFLAPMIREPLEVAMGIVKDKLVYMRWERQQRFMLRANEIANKKGLREPTRIVPMNFAIPLLQAASMEEDDELQDIWAHLLVNAMDADSGVELRRAYIDILENLSPMDARFLSMLYESELNNPGEMFFTYGLPDEFLVSQSPVPHEEKRNPEALSESRKLTDGNISISLLNLERLGCIADGAAWKDAGGTLQLVTITPLGVALIKACTFREMETV